MPQLDPASFPSQLFWLAVCFGTMLLVLSVFVLPRITRTLTARQGQIDGDLEAAEKLRADAEAALAAAALFFFWSTRNVRLARVATSIGTMLF